jgi:capsule polysaccharide export protein KpsE/RkpR
MKGVGRTVFSNERVEDVVTVSTQDGFGWAWTLWMNRRALGRVTAYGLIVAGVLAFITPKRYDSTTRLMPPDPHSNMGSAMLAAMSGQGSLASSALGGIASDLLGTHDPGAVFTDMLRSRTVEDRIVARLDLRRVYRTTYWEDARNDLATSTAIAVDRKSGVTTITVTDHDPNRAAQIAQAYVEELDRIAAEVNTSAAHRERIFIEDRLKTVRQDLDTASKKFSEYASQNVSLDIKEQTRATVEAAATLQGQLIAAQSELEGLEQIYTSENVRVRALKARVDELQRRLKQVGGDTSKPGAANPASDQEFPSLRQLPLLGVQWAALYRDNKIQETVYELLSEQYEMAKIQEAKETPVVKVLDAAAVPERKSGPPRLLLTLLGGFITFVSASTWVLSRAVWEKMDSEDPRKKLGQEIAAQSKSWGTIGLARLRAIQKKLRRRATTDLGEES